MKKKFGITFIVYISGVAIMYMYNMQDLIRLIPGGKFVFWSVGPIICFALVIGSEWILNPLPKKPPSS